MKRKLLVCLVLIAAMMLCAAGSFADDGIPVGPVVEYGDLDTIAEIDGQVVRDYVILKYPTCEETGSVRFDLDDPAETSSYVISVIKKLEHEWSSEQPELRDNWGKVIKEPSCVEEGLAIDVCVRVLPGTGEVCGATRENYRSIDTTPHTFDDDHYDVVKEPTCKAVGLGIRTCIICGAEKEADIQAWTGKHYETLVQIPMLPHDWTDWRVDKESTCKDWGEAHRSCIRCGATQILDKDHQSVKDQGTKTVKRAEIIPKKNDLWNDENKGPVALLDGKDFTDASVLNNALETVKEAVQYDVTKNWLDDCYTRKITVSCKYCHGSEHPNVTYTMLYPLTEAHEWVRSGYSVAPTCTVPGVDVYLCDKDGEHGHEAVVDPRDPTGQRTLADKTKNVYPDSDAYYTVVVPALGHNWSEWEVAQTFEKDGESYDFMIRYCDRCDATENQVVKQGDDPSPEPPTPVKNGLVKDEDGKWRYYENGEFVEKTGIVKFEGGEFWVVDGVVPSDASGVTICPDGKAYFLSQGQILRVSQVAEYKGEWFMIKNGELDESANGLYDYDGGTFVFAAGKLRQDVDGLWLNPKDNKWFFLSQGQVQKVSQVAEYRGEFFLIKNGVLDTAYEGTIEYDGQTFIVVDGQLYGPIN